MFFRIKTGGLEQKGGMFFVTLKDQQPDGSEWTTAAQEKLAAYWSAVSLDSIFVFLMMNSFFAQIHSLEMYSILNQVSKFI